MGRVIWNSKIMEVEDLPTLADALRVADANLLADEVLRLCRPHKGTGKKKTAKARKRVLRTIDEMRSVEPTRHEPADEMVLIPLLTCEYMAGRRGVGFELGMEAELIAVSEMWRAGAELCGLADEKGDGRLVWLMGYGYEWTPWEDALGYRVWLGGFGGDGEKDVAAGSAAATPAPGDKALLPRLVRSSRCQVLSRRDRYRFLAAVVWNMTFCGWTKKRQSREIEKLVARVNEAREEPKNLLSFDDVFSRMDILDADEVGLEASTDDYDSEHERVMTQRAYLAKDWLRLDFLTRVNDLHNMLERGYGQADGGGHDE